MGDIDIEKTRKRNLLIYRTHFIDYFQLSIFIFIILILISIFILVFISIFSSKSNIKFVIYFGLFIIFIISMRIFNEWRARKFTIIDTGQSKDRNKQLMIDLIKDLGFDIIYFDDDYIRALAKEKVLFAKQELTIIFDDSKIQINLVKVTSLSRASSYFDLIEFINKTKEKINTGT